MPSPSSFSLPAEAPERSPFVDWLFPTARALGFPSESALAKVVGVNQSTVTRWKSGSKPSLEHLVKLSEVLGVNVVPLLALSGHISGAEYQGVGLPKPPVMAMSEQERAIMLAPLDEELKSAFERYWQRRCDSESRRLYALIGFASVTDGITTADAVKHVQRALEVRDGDVTELITELLLRKRNTSLIVTRHVAGDLLDEVDDHDV